MMTFTRFQARFAKILAFTALLGGGTPLVNLNAVELSSLCTAGRECRINTPQDEITNNIYFSMGGSLLIEANIGTFINYGTLHNGGNTGTTISIKDDNAHYSIGNLINYGTITGHTYLGNQSGGIGILTNYGFMGTLSTSQYQNNPISITINNFGIMSAYSAQGGVQSANLSAGSSNANFVIQNYSMVINETADEFLAFSGYNGDIATAQKNSHLVISTRGSSASFKDKNSKIILDFGANFELGKEYAINKIATDTNGNTYTALGVDFSRLVPYSDIYYLTQNGENFIVNLKTESSTIGNLYKSNIRTMNNFYTISNSMIYPHKYSAKRTTNKRRVIRRVKKTASAFRHSELSLESEESTNHNKGLDSFALDSSLTAFAQNDGESVPFASLQSESNVYLLSLRESQSDSWQSILESLESLQSNESFAYKNNISNSSNLSNPNNPTNQTKNQTNQTNRHPITTNRTLSTQSNDKYHFILTPFVNHNLFFESGRYNLRGLEYGFLSAFSGKITPSNALGAHFMMSYGSLGDLNDKNFSITNLNLNIGLNYKFDMIWDMYLKARGDFYYFLNQVKTLTIFESIKPNNLGFGLSVAYGKDFNFGSGGTLGVEGGIDYKALQSSNIALQNSADRSVSEIYQKSLYNLIYVDLGLNYAKYFNSSVGLWGLNANMGIKGNVTANKLAKSQVRLNAFNRSVDMTLDNDKVLGYVNLSGSYVLNAKDFNMEFSLAYYGNYGDRVVSNGGGVEMRVVF